MTRTDPRPTWADLPVEVRNGVERILEDTVVEAVSQQHGFSPGTADRVRLASGRTAFIKAATSANNVVTPRLHRTEAAITAALPAGAPAPPLLGMYDDGVWVALVLGDVVGTHPRNPWRSDDVAQVLDTLADMARIAIPDSLELPRNQDELRGALTAWKRIRANPPADLHPWAVTHLEMLVDLEARGVVAMAGENLVHGDLRADNILLTDSGPVFVDWPWATRGAAWTDGLSILVNASSLAPEFAADAWLAEHELFSDVADADVNGVLAGLAGYFIDTSRHPAPPGMPSLRELQASKGNAVLGWLRQRLS